MTTPQYPWGSTSDSDLPQGVVVPSQLGSALQDHSKGKYVALADNRFPAIAKGTAAGSPSSVNGPMGIITRVFSGIVSNVATADPATVKGPDDIVAKAGGFFGGLPLVSFIGDIAGAISGAVGGGLNTIKTFFDDLLGGALQGINPFSIFSRIGDIFFHQAAVANTASSAATAAQQAIVTSDGFTVKIVDLDGRVTALEGIGVRTQYTTSQTWTNPFPTTHRKIGVSCMNAGLDAPGGQARGGVGGEGGGLNYGTFFTDEIPSSIALAIGAGNGAVTSFGSLLRGYNGTGGIVKAEGTYPTSAAPGRGGDAKSNSGETASYSPAPGGSSAFCYSPLGADGQSAPTGVICGGAGGPSGAKGSGPFVAGRGYAGGFPGGGGGAYAGGTANGDIGYGAAGSLWITLFDEGV